MKCLHDNGNPGDVIPGGMITWLRVNVECDLYNGKLLSENWRTEN